jgi:LysM domain
MVDRGLPIVDGAPACPFVAFEDDRDARATAPDHRHRCYAEPRPAPRALAHQDAYCLSSNFPVCPTFQDWARREAAAARPGSASPVFDPRQEPESVPQSHPMPPPDREARHAPAEPLPPRRNPPRDWAAPPPWQPNGVDPETGLPTGTDAAAAAAGAAGFAAASAAARDVAGPPEARGLAGSAADLLAAGRSPVDDRLAEDGGAEDDDAYEADRGYDATTDPPTTSAPPSSGSRGWGDPRATDPIPAPPIPRYGEPDDDGYDVDVDQAAYAAPPPERYAPPPQARPAPPPASRQAPPPPRQPETWSDPDADDVEDDRYAYAPPPSRRNVDRARDRGAVPGSSRAGEPDRRPSRDDGNALIGPAWERPRRYEAYPTLRSRMSVPVPGLPGLSRVMLALAALAVGIVALFFLPGMLNLGGSGGSSGATSTPSATASSTPEPSPTATPEPTPIIHVVAQGQTLSKIAKQYGLTLDQLLAANPQIKNPNKIKIGDQLTIPTPPPDDSLGASADPSAS